ncbi:MAG: molybdopterin-dependent oxidoreductase [Desulfobacterales bacterium]|nr:molybdopterin-dependent oxidoreductase [Desulfobacterales bacterium]
MINRRQALKRFLTIGSGLLCVFSYSTLCFRIPLAWAKRRILEKTASLSELIHANPKDLDTHKLETTPIEQFDVMGQTNHPVDIDDWQFEVRGAVITPTKFSYQDLIQRPVLERNVLLICAGFFAYNGLWKGFSVADLLNEIGLKSGVTHIKFRGPQGIRGKTKKFTIEEVIANKVFIAYGVNDQVLPERHGFPMRLVAEDHKGYHWVKYVDRLTVIAK